MVGVDKGGTNAGGSIVSDTVISSVASPTAALRGSSSAGGRTSGGTMLLDGNDLTSLREVLSRFRSLDKDVVGEEIKTLEYPLDLGLLERRVAEYSSLEEALGTRLGGHLIANYEGFARGMQYVQQVDLEFAYIRVKIKNSRRRLETADSALGQGGLYVARQRRRSERIRAVLNFSAELQSLLGARERMKELAAQEKYHDAIKLNARVLQTVRSDRFQVHGSNPFGALREDIRSHFEETKQQLRERSRRAAVAAEVKFDADAYEDVLDALVAAGIAEGPITDGYDSSSVSAPLVQSVPSFPWPQAPLLSALERSRCLEFPRNV